MKNSILKFIAKKICPPIVTDMFRKKNKKYTWEGIFQHRINVPDSGGNYEDEKRIQELKKHTEEALKLNREGCFLGFERHLGFGFLAACIADKKNKLNILDFGGGAGTGFVELLSVLKKKAEISYHIVDFEKTCEAGRSLFNDDKRIQFHSSIPEFKNGIDLIYVSSVLQYIDDYAALIKTLTNLQAQYLFLGDLPAGQIPTYAARQLNLSGQVLAYWFFNVDEIIKLVELSGYSCIYSGKCNKDYDQTNYPVTHRIGKMKNLLFSLNNS